MIAIRKRPKFEVGEWVEVKAILGRIFPVQERRRVSGKSGYPKWEYLEVFTWWKESDLRKVAQKVKR